MGECVLPGKMKSQSSMLYEEGIGSNTQSSYPLPISKDRGSLEMK